MIDENRQCEHWGIDKVEDRPYCGQHINSVYLAADTKRRNQERRALWKAREDRYLSWHELHPSVFDTMPDDWQVPEGWVWVPIGGRMPEAATG